MRAKVRDPACSDVERGRAVAWLLEHGEPLTADDRRAAPEDVTPDDVRRAVRTLGRAGAVGAMLGAMFALARALDDRD